MTADDLTRRAIIAAHDAEHAAQGSDDVSTYPPLSKREAAIVEAWRADHEVALQSVQKAYDRAKQAEAAIERARALADQVENRMMATAKPSEIRAALDGTEPDDA